VDFDDKLSSRNARAAARRERMTIEIVALGETKAFALREQHT
jgi:hypothetical protein